MHLNHLYSKLNGEIHITQWQTTKMKKISNGKGLSTHIEFFNYLSLSTILMFNSSNWSSETELGDSSMGDVAEVVFGKAITSRILLLPVRSITMRSNPKAIPPCGGVPYFRASNKNPKRAFDSASVSYTHLTLPTKA